MSSDAHTGGDLSDLAVKGTKIPNDAGIQNTIPSKPRPGQADVTNTSGGLGAENLAGAAENPKDMPAGPVDTGATGEVITGQGDQLPPGVEKKHF
ncbi:hypothetical protein L228DRAFT_247893 [Xylona heveae TC161]|uniref:Uncharacterized protein n=1 Tax=Xylona heveae (strain CBS 132557 / TC161) TaxID=1328760 RepID=A0A165GJ09_XYLHT|nr:hypothetical protein L228DRAFT_247893 [Xylona heveae TC161]KZF22245.1 hypothetical protein L228DRAFT_247893 [Xylona heveae TC161]